MRFSSIFLAAAAFVAGVAAQNVSFTDDAFGTLLAGKPFDITWADADGPVTITLKNGATNNLQTVATIASGLTGTSFTWTPSASLPSGDYALEISDGTTTNYSPQFVLGGGSATVSVSGSASASASASGSTGTVTATGTASTASLPSISTASGSTSSSASSTASTSTHATTLSKQSSSATASASASTHSDSTATAATQTTTSSASSTSSTPLSTTKPPDSGAAGLASPLAFVLLAVAALITLN